MLEKPPVFGMLQRNRSVIMRVLANVRQTSIEPIVERFVRKGSSVFTDEYDIYSHLTSFGYVHSSVCHSQREYARDDDGDGVREVHTNSIEGVWSLLRSWLMPHRGVSQERLQNYLSFFQYAHNTRKRGKKLLPSVLSLFLDG